jgi:hypothetical protein
LIDGGPSCEAKPSKSEYVKCIFFDINV